jgi:hypothetical protein
VMAQKDPLVVDVVQRRVMSRTYRRQQGHEEMGVVRRDRDRDNQQVVPVDVSLSNAAPETPLWRAAWPKPNIASRQASSAARARPVWRMMRSAIGLAGTSIKRFRFLRRGCW